MSSQYEKRKLAQLNEKMANRKLRKTRQKLGYKDEKENDLVEREDEDENWGDSLNTTRSSLRSKVSARRAPSPKKTSQKDHSTDLNRSSGSNRATRASARRSEEWQVSGVSSNGNKNEDVEDDSDDGTDERLVIDEAQEVDHRQEARRRREEFAQFQAKMDAETKKNEEESKKQLAELKERQARRKAERQAKLEERRRQLEAEEESSGESDSTLINDPDKVQTEEAENNEATLVNGKTVTIEQNQRSKPSRRSKASMPMPNFESENQGKLLNPLETSNISNFDPPVLSTPKPSPMPSATEPNESTENDGFGIQTSQTYQTQEKSEIYFIGCIKLVDYTNV